MQADIESYSVRVCADGCQRIEIGSGPESVELEIIEADEADGNGISLSFDEARWLRDRLTELLGG